MAGIGNMLCSRPKQAFKVGRTMDFLSGFPKLWVDNS